MAEELGEKRKEEMRLVAQIAAERPAHFSLDRFKLLPQREGLMLRHDWDRREIARFFVLRDLCFGQQFRHGCAPRRKRAFISRHSAWTLLLGPSIRIEQRALFVSHQSGFVKKNCDPQALLRRAGRPRRDRKSTRLNSSHIPSSR